MKSIVHFKYLSFGILSVTVGAGLSANGCSTTAVGTTDGGSSSSSGSSSGAGAGSSSSSSGAGASSSSSGAGASSSSGGSSGGSAGCFPATQAVPPRCVPAMTTLVTNFDDFMPTSADGSVTPPADYTFYVNGQPPAANSLLGGLLFINDGDGTPGVTMVPGYNNTTYAAQFGTTTPVGLVDASADFGGFLELYFPAVPLGCVEPTGYNGISFWAEGTSGASTFGVTIGTVESVPIPDGACDNSADAASCGDFTAKYTLPAVWTQFQVPWSSFTGGHVTSGCATAPGSGIIRIQFFPYELYAPPAYTISPMPYTMTVDDVEFY